MHNLTLRKLLGLNLIWRRSKTILPNSLSNTISCKRSKCTLSSDNRYWDHNLSKCKSSHSLDIAQTQENIPTPESESLNWGEDVAPLFQPRRAVILTKMTRYEYERRLCESMSDKEFRDYVRCLCYCVLFVLISNWDSLSLLERYLSSLT